MNHYPKRNVFLIGACLLATAIFLLLPSFTARSVLATILFLIAAVLVVREFLAERSSKETETAAGASKADHESSQEALALGKLFDATMSGMREGLLVVDKDMRVVASNPAALRLFNPSRGKLQAQRLTEITRNPAIYGAFLDALKGSERSGVRVETHGPEPMVFDLRTVPLGGGPNGQTAEGALGVFIDVTRIERLERVRQEFLSNVSHELRTPLTAILAFVETLETSAIDDKENSLRFLSIVRRNASRMHDLIDDILELSAIEAGNVEVKAEPIELRPVVNDVISWLSTKAASRGIVVANEVARDAMVFADARRLEQMLTNLVDNAIKFNRENGEVTIRFESSADAGAHRGKPSASDRILVEDTGEGIPAQHLARLFERFYRVDRARSREMGGTGLGLAIVKHLARAHGGEISVTSELGKGSSFIIELPSFKK
jgi:two-component system phosphate regulon sensor histidine kinase PhoR